MEHKNIDSIMKIDLEATLKKFQIKAEIIVDKQLCKNEKEITSLIVDIAKRTIISSYELKEKEQKNKEMGYWIYKN